jgi:putative ABC transport system permease protein
MPSSLRVPLAWLNLTHSKGRFALALAGITFAVVLMLIELGFLHALLDSQVRLLDALDADFFLISSAKSTITDSESFPLGRVYQARSAPQVLSAEPFYVRYSPFIWKNPREEAPGGKRVMEWPIRVLAFDPDAGHPVFREFRMPEVAAQWEALSRPNTALLDARSKPLYDLAAQPWLLEGPAEQTPEREVAGQALRIVGRFRLGTDFTTDGNLLMSTKTLARFPVSPDPARPVLDFVQLGVVKLRQGADPTAAAAALAEAVPEPDVRLVPKDELMWKEKRFWLMSTPIGFIFVLGLVVGFIVGVVICYQILATEVADHLGEYATLKAIGYRDRYLNGVVLQEALWLSGLGFLLGLGLGWPLYLGLEWKTGLPLQITLGRAGLILVLTVGMCLLSGFLALRRVRSADPAEVFS